VCSNDLLPQPTYKADAHNRSRFLLHPLPRHSCSIRCSTFRYHQPYNRKLRVYTFAVGQPSTISLPWFGEFILHPRTEGSDGQANVSVLSAHFSNNDRASLVSDVQCYGFFQLERVLFSINCNDKARRRWNRSDNKSGNQIGRNDSPG
jgi:hypothetical protein